jgi:hypothetical protein
MAKSSPLSLGWLMMGLLFALIAGLLVLSLSTQGANAQTTQDEDAVDAQSKRKVDSANGKGGIEDTGSGTTSRFEFNAKNLDRVSGEASGTVSFANSNGSDSQSAKGSIECLRVNKVDVKKAGYFIFRVTESSGTDAPPVGTPIGVNVVDTGKKHGKGDGVLGAPVGEPGDPTPPCLDPSGEVEPLTNGNITIHDVVKQLPA